MWEIWVVGSACLLAAYKWFPDKLRFNLMGSLKFMLSDLMLTMMLAVIVQSILFWQHPEQIDHLVDQYLHSGQLEQSYHLASTPYYKGALAGLEDAVFVLPVLVTPYPWKLLVGTITTLSFTYGHQYQGTVGMWCKVGYVPLATVFASRYGILTTIASHAFKDIVALAMLKWIVRNIEKFNETSINQRYPSPTQLSVASRGCVSTCW